VIESIKEFDPSMTSIGPLLRDYQINNGPTPIMSFIDSVLPNSALLEETTASEVAIEGIEKLGAIRFLNLAAFLISNNFPGESQGQKIYEWLQTHGSPNVFKAISSMEGFTATALLDNLFRLAIEAGDVTTVEHLLKAKFNPNGHKFRYGQIPGTLNALQFACITGKVKLAQALIKAGTGIEETDLGWKSSILVLALIGENISMDNSYPRGYETKDGPEYDPKIFCKSPIDDDASLLVLFSSLIDVGAKVNPKAPPPFRGADSLKDKNTLHGSSSERNLPYALRYGHSPLTAASTYRNKDVVSMLIRQGADVNFLTGHGTSALQECLYSGEKMSIQAGCYDEWISLYRHRKYLARDTNREGNIVTIARDLLNAGADRNISTFYNFGKVGSEFDHHKDRPYCYYFSPLDLAALTGMNELVEMLLEAGAKITQWCLRLATQSRSLQIFERLVEMGAPISNQTGVAAMIVFGHCGMDAILRRRQDTQTKRLAMLAAIRFDATYLMKNVLSAGVFDSNTLFDEPPLLEYAMSNCVYGSMKVFRTIFDDRCISRSKLIPYLNSALHGEPLELGDNQMELLVAAGADVNARTARNKTILLAAIRTGNITRVRKLIGLGAALNTEFDCCLRSHNHHRPSGDALVVAIELGDDIVIECLLTAGADINAPGSSRDCEWICHCKTPLTTAISKQAWKWVDYLLASGALVNNPPEVFLSTTPLAAAICFCRNVNFVQRLLDLGASLRDSRAFEEAVCDIKLLRVLLTKAAEEHEWNIGTNFARGALDKAIQSGGMEIIEVLLDSHLLDVNSVWNDSRALYSALKSGTSPNLDILRMLLRFKADPNEIIQVDSHLGPLLPLQTALSQPALGSVRKVEILELLLQAGARPDGSLARGMVHVEYTALQLAVAFQPQLEVVRKLLEYGADPNATSLSGRIGTPIQLAAESKQVKIIDILLRYNANPNGVTSKVMDTALQIATRNGCKEMVELLIEYGADVNSPSAEDSGATALQYAAVWGFLGIAYLLLENGADVNALPARINGRTALEGAAEHGRIDMVQLLLNAGAEVYGNGQVQYERALVFASSNGHHATRRLLEEYRS
jgi:ankyrin repeat protein